VPIDVPEIFMPYVVGESTSRLAAYDVVLQMLLENEYLNCIQAKASRRNEEASSFLLVT
jgi:hypothetical protein